MIPEAPTCYQFNTHKAKEKSKKTQLDFSSILRLLFDDLILIGLLPPYIICHLIILHL